MTNHAKVVRAETDEHGARLRLWIEDDDGRHVAVAEMGIEESAMILWAREIAAEQNRSAQYMLGFDD